MAFSARNLVRLSLGIVRTRVSVPTTSISLVRAMSQLTHRSPNPSSTVDEGLVLDETTPDGKPKHIGRIREDMLELIKHRDVEETLTFVHKYHQNMNTHHVYRCYGNIQRQLPNLEPEMVQNIREDDRFKRLCILAGKKAPHFGPKHCVYMIRSLVDLGCKSDSILLQIFLELCKHHINDLSMMNVALLGSNLTKLEPTSRIDVLKRGLALAVDNNFERELGSLKTDQIIDSLEAFAPHLAGETVELIILSLKLREESRYFDRPEVVLDTLKEINVRDNDLIRICCDLSQECLDGQLFGLDEVTKLLRALYHFHWYSQEIFESSVDYIISQGCDWRFELQVCNLLIECNYFPTRLIMIALEELNFEETIDDESREIVWKVLNDADGLLKIDSENIRQKFNLPDYQNFHFESNCNFLLDAVEFRELDLSNILLLETEDYFRNNFHLRGPQRRCVEKLQSEGKKICVVSRQYLQSVPETERMEILKRTVTEALSDGYSQLLYN